MLNVLSDYLMRSSVMKTTLVTLDTICEKRTVAAHSEKMVQRFVVKKQSMRKPLIALGIAQHLYYLRVFCNFEQLLISQYHSVIRCCDSVFCRRICILKILLALRSADQHQIDSGVTVFCNQWPQRSITA